MIYHFIRLRENLPFVCLAMETIVSDGANVLTHNPSSAEILFNRKAQGCQMRNICWSVHNYEERGKKIRVNFEVIHCRNNFTLKNEIFWDFELSWNSLAIHCHFAFWSKQHHLVSARSPEPACLCFSSTVCKGTVALWPMYSAGAQPLPSASLRLNLATTSTVLLSTLCWILS